MLSKHLLRLLIFAIWVQILNLRQLFVGWLRSFAHISHKVHAWAQLINNQIREHHEVIIFYEFLNLLDPLLKFFDFSRHLLASSDSSVYRYEWDQLLSEQRQTFQAFLFLVTIYFISEGFKFLGGIVLFYFLEGLKDLLRRFVKGIHAILSVKLKLEIDVVQSSQDLGYINVVIVVYRPCAKLDCSAVLVEYAQDFLERVEIFLGIFI